jgi:RND family efflux transporter MFP subunit
MKNISFLLTLTLLLSACGGGEKKLDKKAQLADLRQKQSKIAGEIAALEKELSVSDTTKIAEKSKNVTLAEAKQQTFNHFIELPGAIIADDEVFVNAKVPGSLIRVSIKVGDKVSAGDVVAEIDDAILQNNVAEVQKRWELANEVFQKQESLWKQNIGAEIQYLTAKNNKEALEKTMSTLQETREMYKVKAAISGVVDEVAMKIGQTAAPGIPLAKIVNLSKLKVKADVPESYAGKVRTGNSVTIHFPDLNKDVSGSIKYIGNAVNPMNRTFKVEVPVSSMDGLLPNMLSIIKVTDYSNSNAFIVPINLLQKADAGDFVLIAEKEGDKWRAKRAMVKIGRLYKDQAEILSGLKTGEQLIVTGYQDLNEGDLIAL